MSRVETAATRRREAAQAASLIGAAYDCANIPDLGVFVDDPTRRATVEVIRRHAPDIVLTAIDALHPLIDETVVVHARGETVDAPHAIEQPHTGKGDAMRHGLEHTTGELVAYFDTDTEDFTPAFITGLLGPLLTQPVDFVKGHFRRPLKIGDTTQPDQGGRVTELLARPYLNLHFPQLAEVARFACSNLAQR